MSGLKSLQASADRVIELVEQEPAPIRAAAGEDAEEILRLVDEKSDAELDALRLQYVGLAQRDQRRLQYGPADEESKL